MLPAAVVDTMSHYFREKSALLPGPFLLYLDHTPWRPFDVRKLFLEALGTCLVFSCTLYVCLGQFCSTTVVVFFFLSQPSTPLNHPPVPGLLAPGSMPPTRRRFAPADSFTDWKEPLPKEVGRFVCSYVCIGSTCA